MSDNSEFKPLLESLQSSLATMMQDRNPWKETWKDICDLVLPRRSGVDDTAASSTPNIEISDKRIDSTATEAANMLADGLMGYTVSPAYPWFRITLEKDQANKARANRAWLDEVEKVMYSEFERSKFYSVMPETFADGGTIGTATLYIDEDIQRDRLQFISVHPFEVYIEEDAYGEVTKVFRVFTMTDEQAKGEFGADAFTGSDIQPGVRRVIVHAVLPNTEDMGIEQLFPWISIYYEKDTENLLQAEGYYENPYTVWRYRKNTGETYGRSPAYDALPDIKVLNQVTKSLARGVQLTVEPPMNAPNSMRGKIKFEPRGMNYYTSPDEIITPIQVRGDYSVGRDYHSMLMDRVKKAFRADIFMSLEAATRQMTAEEVVQRQGEKAAVLGAIVGRLGAELLNPLIQRVFGILMRAGKFPEPPDTLQGEALKIEFNGPLFQAQRRHHQTNGLQQTLQSILPLVEFAPDILSIINWDGVTRQMIEAGGMPATTYRDDSETARIRKAQQQAIAQQKQQEMAQEQMKAIPGLTKTIEPGSPLEQMALAAQSGVARGMQ